MTFVYWYADLWGWDCDPGATPDDFLREQEVGAKVMHWERSENVHTELHFMALPKEAQRVRS